MKKFNRVNCVLLLWTSRVNHFKSNSSFNDLKRWHTCDVVVRKCSHLFDLNDGDTFKYFSDRYKFAKMLLSIKECAFLFVGIALIILGVLLSISWKDFYKQILAQVHKNAFFWSTNAKLWHIFISNIQKLTLEKGSESYEGWKNPPLELNFDVYFFNWTNPTNFTSAEYVKPILEEIGPYRFREKTEKTRIHWNNLNSTVSYRKRSTYYFVPEESQGCLDDVIITLNMVAIVSTDMKQSKNNRRKSVGHILKK